MTKDQENATKIKESATIADQRLKKAQPKIQESAIQRLKKARPKIKESAKNFKTKDSRKRDQSEKAQRFKKARPKIQESATIADQRFKKARLPKIQKIN